jgi:CRP-like cAMP-binding protein
MAAADPASDHTEKRKRPKVIFLNLFQWERAMMANPLAATFDPKSFLATLSRGRSTARYPKGAVIYHQASIADAVYYLKDGRIKIVVASRHGKEAVIAIVEPGAFFGEGCLIGQDVRLATAVAMVESEVTRLDKTEMLRVLHSEPAFGDVFMTHLLVRNSRIEEDLVDQLFNSSEKRLARALLILANFGQKGWPQPITTPVSHETLAEIVGTTRPRVSHFMNKFRKLGFISYNGHLRVHRSLLKVVLHE